jgi:hypothetical protein
MKSPAHAPLLFALWTLCLTGGGCGDPPGFEALVTSRLALQIPAAETTGQGASLRDDLGLYDLARFPVIIRMNLEGHDMDTREAWWPAVPADLTPGPADVDFSLSVPAGNRRTLTATAWVREGGYTYLFVPDGEYLMDLTPGQNNPVELNLVQQPFDSLSGDTEDAAEVWLLDPSLMVLLDRQPVTNGQYEFLHVATGYPLALALVGADGTPDLDELIRFEL